MPIFNVIYDAIRISGTQCWQIEAESEEEARKLVDAGGGEFIDEQLEVMETQFSHVEEVEEE